MLHKVWYSTMRQEKRGDMQMYVKMHTCSGGCRGIQAPSIHRVWQHDHISCGCKVDQVTVYFSEEYITSDDGLEETYRYRAFPLTWLWTVLSPYSAIEYTILLFFSSCSCFPLQVPQSPNVLTCPPFRPFIRWALRMGLSVTVHTCQSIVPIDKFPWTRVIHSFAHLSTNCPHLFINCPHLSANCLLPISWAANQELSSLFHTYPYPPLDVYDWNCIIYGLQARRSDSCEKTPYYS